MIKKRSKIQQLFLCLLTIALMIGCTKVKESDEILIGVAWPFASNNSMFNEGIDLAVKEINEGGGIKGKELKLLKLDDESNTEKGMAIAQAFAQNKEVSAVIGHRASYISLSASSIYADAGLVMLSPASSAPELTKGGYHQVFRVIPSDDEIARQLAIYLARNGFKRMVVYYSDDSYGQGLANSFEDHAKARGITIVDRFNYYNDPSDLNRLHKKWQAFGYDGIFIANTLMGGGNFIYDADKAGIKVPFVAGNALDTPQLWQIAGEAAEGTIIGSVFNPNLEHSAVRKFVDSFILEYNEMPIAHAALGYDAVKMMAAAIDNSKSMDAIDIAAALKGLGNWPGAAGIHRLNDRGDNVGNIVELKVFTKGNLEYLAD